MHPLAIIKRCDHCLKECDVSWQLGQCPWLSRRAAARAVGERRLLHRGGASVENVPLPVQTSSQCASGQCEYSVDVTQGSVESCETFLTTGLRWEPVAQAEVFDDARPFPRPRVAGGGPDRAETRPPDTAGSEKNFAPFMAGVLLFARVPKANHMAPLESKGRGRVVSSPGYKLGMSCGNCSFTPRRTISSTSPNPGANVR